MVPKLYEKMYEKLAKNGLHEKRRDIETKPGDMKMSKPVCTTCKIASLYILKWLRIKLSNEVKTGLVHHGYRL